MHGTATVNMIYTQKLEVRFAAALAGGWVRDWINS